MTNEAFHGLGSSRAAGGFNCARPSSFACSPSKLGSEFSIGLQRSSTRHLGDKSAARLDLQHPDIVMRSKTADSSQTTESLVRATERSRRQCTGTVNTQTLNVC